LGAFLGEGHAGHDQVIPVSLQALDYLIPGDGLEGALGLKLTAKRLGDIDVKSFQCSTVVDEVERRIGALGRDPQALCRVCSVRSDQQKTYGKESGSHHRSFSV
jgi:hypothetical protein